MSLATPGQTVGESVARERCPGGADGHCEASDTTLRVQRRDSVRVPCVSDVYVAKRNAERTRCESVDLSGSGFLAVVPGLNLAEGDDVSVHIRMDNGFAISVSAVVIRSVQPSSVAFQFIDLPQYLHDLIVKQLFVEQRKTLAARSGQ